MVLAPGVLTGLAASGFSRNCVAAKSPMTGGIGKSEVGGYFGAELKHAGYDAIIIEGKAEKPVYLWIKDGVAEIRDASLIWGKSVLETEQAIRADVGEKYARIASIGPAGEKLVRFACVINDLKDAAGRGGMGAVMGSKNLKAVAVRGTTPPPLADAATIKLMAKEMALAAPSKARSVHEYGTGADMEMWDLVGNIPTRNFSEGKFGKAEAISATTLKKTIGIGMEGCYACAVRCKKVVKVDEPWIVDPQYGGPEYETLAAFGSDCGVDNLKAVAKAHEMSQHYGMDTISAGATIAFAMECFEKGYLTTADTDGMELTWGDPDVMLKLLKMIGERQGIGDLLAEGSRLAAKKIGNGAEDLSMDVKGVELAMHEPRFKQGLGVGFAVASIGGDHCAGPHDTVFEKDGPAFETKGRTIGVPDPMPASELSPRKAHLVAQHYKLRELQDSLCQCILVPWAYEEVVRLINASTGWDTDFEEHMLVGERAVTLGRAFNVREGFTPADDTLPARFFAPPPQGSLAEKQQAVDPALLKETIKRFYELMGWDRETGVPTRETLERLDIGWVADELASR